MHSCGQFGGGRVGVVIMEVHGLFVLLLQLFPQGGKSDFHKNEDLVPVGDM